MNWNLSTEAIGELTGLPETGMGFQWVWTTGAHPNRRFIVFNCELAYDLTNLELMSGDDPAIALANGQMVVRAIRESTATLFAAPQPSRFELLESRIALSTAAGISSHPIARPSSLIKSTTLAVPRVFHRYSAYHPDRRVDSATGDFLPGTYAVPESELPFIPTGFAAVGRLALPVSLPASHHYVIEAKAGTKAPCANNL